MKSEASPSKAGQSDLQIGNPYHYARKDIGFLSFDTYIYLQFATECVVNRKCKIFVW